MGIVAEDVARVRAATDFAAVVGEHVALRRVGNRMQGLCPFHAEKTPSFSVNPAEGLYYCFGCQASGDVITFVRETQHIDFVGAVEWLAARAGITLRYDDARTSRDQQRRAALLEVMERAVDWYHERLLTASDAGAARRYLRERGYDSEAVRSFRLGWAPDEWDALSRSLRVSDDVLVETGLGIVNSRRRQQDSFRKRVMFPIFDVGGHAVAFGGRILPGGEGPKYKNSPETTIYAKRRTLYGLNWAKAGVVEAGEVVVCEGYTDVIGFFRAGVPRAVATCGTALADEHFRTLKNFARRVVLAYDADAAGQMAADRFYRWEKEFDIDIAVVSLPPGSDPGELAMRDPDALRASVTGATAFLAFRVDRLLDRADLRTPEGRARAAEAALEAIAEHPSDLVRDQYVMALADRCRIDADRLRGRISELRTQGPARDGASRPGVPGRAGASRTGSQPRGSEDGDPGPRDPDGETTVVARPPSRRFDNEGPELEALLLAVQRPESVAPYLEEVLFANDVNRDAFGALSRSHTLHGAVDSAGPEAALLLRRLAVEDQSGADPVEVVALLVRRATLRALADLEAQARASQSVIDLTWPKRRIEELDEHQTRVEAAGQLVAWLVRSAEEGA